MKIFIVFFFVCYVVMILAQTDPEEFSDNSSVESNKPHHRIFPTFNEFFHNAALLFHNIVETPFGFDFDIGTTTERPAVAQRSLNDEMPYNPVKRS
ncbi:hypothetical protein PGB90_002389 [Kerria lacca]